MQGVQFNPQASYALRATGYNQLGQKIFEQDDYINADYHTESIFIQTDKAIYKPGSLVRYRVIVVTPEMKPSRSTVTLKIKDQKQNVITQLLNQPLNKVLSKDLQLSDEPPLGPWTISVKTSDGNEEMQTFTVEKYVLPKFEVEVDTTNGDKALTTDTITAKIKATYTFGQPVIGPVTVTAEPAYYSFNRFGPPPPPIAIDGRFGGPLRPTSFSGPRPVTRQGRLDQNGELTVTFSNAELKESKVIQEYGGQLNISASVTEPLTSEQRDGFKLVQLFREPVRFDWEKPSQNFVPGDNYKLTMRLKTYDEKPLPRNFPRTVSVNITHQQRYMRPPPTPIPLRNNGRVNRPFRPFQQPTSETEQRTVTLDEEGKAVITFKGRVNVTSVSLQAEYKYDPRDSEAIVRGYENVQAAQSPSENYLTVTTPPQAVRPGDMALFYVSSTEPIGSISVLVVSKGKILSSLDYELGQSRTGRISIQTTAAMAPRSRVLAFKMRPENKEIIADSAVMKVTPGQRNQVQVFMSPPRAQPGDKVTVRVRSQPDAFVGLLAVDKSVQLMGSNDITQDSIDQEFEKYNYPGYPRFAFGRRKRSVLPPWYGGGSTARAVFQSAQVAVLTDAWLYDGMQDFGRPMPRGINGPMPAPMPDIMPPPTAPPDFGPVPFVVDGPMPMPMQPAPPPPAPVGAPRPEAGQIASGALGGFGSTAGGPAATKTRSKFPETWIWRNGETIMTTTAPDTITTWLASAFALDDRSGLAVTQDPLDFEVFQRFFVRANLPYSVKRGEQLGLQVLVFNYQPTSQQVTVTLNHNASSGFDFADQNGQPIKAGRGSVGYNTKTLTVGGPGKSTADVFFPIIPTDIGNVKLRIEARGSQSADIIEKNLLVEPEGYMVEINKPVTMDLTRNRRFRDSVSVNVPRDIVPGSERAEVSVTGTVMGPAVQNVKSLVRMPSGCGEQNMIGFVPNIVVMRYLKASQQLEPALEASAKRNMESGYQRELNYKHNDGSYSAFGESDGEGSTWLTAFVMKSFAQAKDYIFIDDKIIKEGMQFLKEQQRAPGGFEQSGEVHHKAMQGGAGSGVALTAYVLIAMLENNVQNQRAQALLERSLNSVANDPYTLSITTYALHRANSPSKEQAMQLLERAAVQENGKKFWKDRTSSAEYEQDKPDYWEQPPATDVESTAYALLTYLLRNDMQNALPVVRWLTNQRNPYGGFTSTQDTVVALQGLGAFAERAYRDGLRANVQVQSGQDFNQFQVDPTNAIVLQQAKVTNPTQAVVFEATGTGMVTGQLTLRYNTKRRKANDPFDCSPRVNQKSLNDITVSMCCRNKQPGKTKMAVLEMNTLSGYSIDGEKLQELTAIPDLQRVETEKGNSRANIYFNSLGQSPTCFNVSSSKSFDVASPKAAMMSLYDYYSPEKRIEMEYAGRSSQPLSVTCPRCWEGQGQGAPAQNPSVNPWVWDARSRQWVLRNPGQTGSAGNNQGGSRTNNRNNYVGQWVWDSRQNRYVMRNQLG